MYICEVIIFIYLITVDILPFHDSFRSPVTVETSELALVLLDGGGHAVGEVLPAVRDHVPGVGTVRVEDKPMVKGVSTKFCGNFHKTPSTASPCEGAF